MKGGANSALTNLNNEIKEIINIFNNKNEQQFNFTRTNDRDIIKYMDLVSKYIDDNPYIKLLFYLFEFPYSGKDLNSSISLYEVCFISLLVKQCIKLNSSKPELNILEIGFAYGTSQIVILNQLLKSDKIINYDVIDPNQTKGEWQNFGNKHVDTFLSLCYNDKKDNLNNKLYEYNSDIVLNPEHYNECNFIPKEYDIIFIDEGHGYDVVKADLNNSDSLLVKNGLMIIDDALQEGVKQATKEFFTNNKYRYQKIAINIINFNYKVISDLYNPIYNKGVDDITHKKYKEHIFNPSTMICLKKIN
jgi:predicted O-methyltransferase YrrM